MEVSVNYASGTQLKNNIIVPTLTTSEQDLFVVNDLRDLKFSQLAVYVGVTLGTSASSSFNYYCTPDNGTTWIPVSLYATSTGVITPRTVVIDSTTYATGGKSYYLDYVPLPGTTGFKVTGFKASGTATLDVVTIIGRNN